MLPSRCYLWLPLEAAFWRWCGCLVGAAWVAAFAAFTAALMLGCLGIPLTPSALRMHLERIDICSYSYLLPLVDSFTGHSTSLTQRQSPSCLCRYQGYLCWLFHFLFLGTLGTAFRVSNTAHSHCLFPCLFLHCNRQAAQVVHWRTSVHYVHTSFTLIGLLTLTIYYYWCDRPHERGGLSSVTYLALYSLRTHSTLQMCWVWV